MAKCGGDGVKDKKPMSEARISGMVATVVLVVMFGLVALIVWVGS